MLKSKPAQAQSVRWVAARGPHGDAALAPAVRAHRFCEEDAAPAAPLPLAAADVDVLLANKAIHFRSHGLIINAAAQCLL